MSNLPPEKKSFLIKSKLQNFPYWRSGHLFFARQGLMNKNLSEAYAAAQAALLLSKGAREKAEALHLVARTMIASHQPARAMELLRNIPEPIQQSAEVQEDIAACYLALEQEEDALMIFNELGHARLSPEGRAMLSYLEKKSTNKLYE